MEIGDDVQVRACKADGTCYRWWRATVEAVEADGVVLVTPAGHRVEGIHRSWTSRFAIRAFYWPDRLYNVLEVYALDGTLVEIYVNISSPAVIEDSQVSFTDYELDIDRRPPGEAQLEDEDEFREAALRYGYSQAFQETCYQVAREMIELANSWVARGMPTVGPAQAQE
jgi:protein associated with RNAse G/E